MPPQPPTSPLTSKPRLDQLRGEQRTLRERAEALEAEAVRVKREEEAAIVRQRTLQEE